MTLREYIDKYDLNINQFASEIGVDRVTLYRYFRGQTMPREATIIQIMRATGNAVMANDLLGTYLRAKHKYTVSKRKVKLRT